MQKARKNIDMILIKKKIRMQDTDINYVHYIGAELCSEFKILPIKVEDWSWPL